MITLKRMNLAIFCITAETLAIKTIPDFFNNLQISYHLILQIVRSVLFNSPYQEVTGTFVTLCERQIPSMQ